MILSNFTINAQQKLQATGKFLGDFLPIPIALLGVELARQQQQTSSHEMHIQNRSAFTQGHQTSKQYIRSASETGQSLAGVNEDLRDRGCLQPNQVVEQRGSFNDREYLIRDRGATIAQANTRAQKESRQEKARQSKVKKETGESISENTNDPIASVSLNHKLYNNLFKISCSNNGLQNNQAIQKKSGNLLKDNGPPSYAKQDVLETGTVIACGTAPLPPVVNVYGGFCLGAIVVTTVFALSKKLSLELEKRLGLVQNSTDRKNVSDDEANHRKNVLDDEANHRKNVLDIDRKFSRTLEVYKQYNEKKLTVSQAYDTLKRFSYLTEPQIAESLSIKPTTN